MKDSDSLEPTTKQSKAPAERGNVFFALFGAVAVVGILGAGIMSTMRGPLSSMVEINRIEEAKANMRIGARLLLVASSDQDADALTEPIDPTSTNCDVTIDNAGCIPTSVSASKVDPWGNAYAYCAWNLGNDSDALGSNIMEGDVNPNYYTLAVISAGPDQTFQSNCTGPGTTPSSVGPNVEELGDDLVVPFTYSQAIASSGGLWTQNELDSDQADIDKNLNIDGSATFTGDVDLSGVATAQLKLGAASLLLPDDTELSNCNGGNQDLVRINKTRNPNRLELCDNNVWISAATTWDEDGSGNLSYDDGSVTVDNNFTTTGTATLADADVTVLDVTGTATLADADVTVLDVTGTATLADADITDADIVTLDVTGVSTLADADITDADITTLDVTGTTTVTVVNASGNIDTDGAFTMNNGAEDLTPLECSDDQERIHWDGDSWDCEGATPGGSGTGGALILDDLDDVYISSPGNNECLIYVSSDSRWEATDCTDAGVFETDGASGSRVVRLVNSNAAWSTTDLVFGGSALDNQTGVDDDARIIFDKSLGAFRAGTTTGVQWDVGNLGGNSVAFGLDTTASGTNSFAAGQGTIASNDHAFAGGRFSYATGESSTALGRESLASGDNSAAIGFASTASGLSSFTLGGEVRATGDNSAAFGLADQINTDANRPQVSGTNSLGIFMTQADDYDLSGNNQFGLIGGEILLDGNADATEKGCIRYNDGISELEFSNDCSAYNSLSDISSQIWTPDGANNYIEYDDTLGGVRIGKVTGQPAPATDWYLDASNSIVYTSTNTVAIGSSTTSTGGEQDLELDVTGDIGATNYCDADGDDCFTAATAGSLWENDGPEGPAEIYYNAGNVGIGTNDPDAKLHVSGSTGSGIGAIIENAGGAARLFLKANTNSASDLNLGDTDSDNVGRIRYNHADNSMAFDVNGSTQVILDSAGNVGIGTTDPTQGGDQPLVLEVAGAVGASHYCDEAGLNCSTPAGLTALASATTALDEITNAVADNTLTNAANQQIWNWELAAAETGITFGESAASAGGANNQYIVAAKTLAASTAIPLYIENAGAGDSFRVADEATDTTPFVIDADGNVGIGTDEPDALLHLIGAMDPGVDGADTTSIKLTNSPNGLTWRLSSGIGGVAHSSFAIGTTGINPYFIINGNAGLGTVGAIGIGDTTPDTGDQALLLDVEGPVGATHYCDEAGNNCFTSGDVDAASIFEVTDTNGATAGGEVVRQVAANAPIATADFVFGSTQLDNDTGTTDDDSRMFFDKSKGAFRAGSTDSDGWDSGNIGGHSTAMGFRSRAQGTASVAIGYRGQALGSYSIALGIDTRADSRAIAIGSSSTASGSSSLVLGAEVRARGSFSAAIGLSDQTNTDTDRPQVSGIGSLGIFMDTADSYDLSATDQLGIIGGELMIDGSFPNDTPAALADTNRGCIRYNDTDDALEFSNDCTNYASITDLATGTNIWQNDGAGGPAEIYYNGGNVGIGTDDPSRNLDIKADTLASLRLTADNAGSDPAIAAKIELVGYEGRAKGLFITDADNTDEWFAGELYGYNGFSIGHDTIAGGQSEYGANSLFTVRSSGAVGIGTTDPTQGGDQPLKLDVQGAIGGTHYCDQAGLNCFTPTDVLAANAVSELGDLADAITDYATDNNIIVGDGSGGSLAVGAKFNTIFGESAFAGTTTLDADSNTAFGYNTLAALTEGANNTVIGYQAGDSITTGDNNIVIGSGVDVPSAAGNDQLNIGDTIFGNLSSATIGIGDFSADTIESTLHLQSGDIRLDGGAAGAAGCIRYNDTDDELEFSDDCANYTSITDLATGTNIWQNDGAGGPAEIYYNGGNVGIGTDDPNEALEVVGNIQLQTGDYLIGRRASGNSMNLIGTPAGTQTIQIGESTSVPDAIDIQLPTDSGQGMTIRNGTANLVFFENNGNVGIGTVTPRNPLSVVGSISVETADADVRTGDSLGLLAFRSNESSTNSPPTNDIVASIEAVAKAQHTSGYWPTDLAFSIPNTSNALTEVVRITSVSNETRFGIGTDSPNDAFHLFSPDPDFRLEFNGSPDSDSASLDFANNGTLEARFFYSRSTDDLTFRQNFDGGTTGNFIFTDGNVGIGTTEPTQDGDQPLVLEIAGAVGATHYCDEAGDNCSTPAGLTALAAATTALDEITNAVADNTLTNDANEQIWNWELAAAETGITFGETAASAGGSDDQYIVAAKTLAASTAIPLYVENLGAGDSFRIADEATDTTPFVIDADGNVGIGTDGPSEKLSIYQGDIILDDGVTNQQTKISEGEILFSRNSSFGYTGIIDVNTSIDGNRQTLRLSNREGVQLDYNTRGRLLAGNLGVLIGVSTSADSKLGSPLTPLHVIGTSYFNGTVGIDDSSPDQGGDQPLKLDVAGAIGGTHYCDEDGLNCFTPTDVLAANAVSELGDLSDAITDYATDNNMIVGQGSGGSLAVGATGNTIFGHDAFAGTTTASADNNTAFGLQALAANTTGGTNTAIGYQTINSNISGSSNTALGYQALSSNETASSNVAIGRAALSLTNATANTGIGSYSLQNNTTGANNVGVGSATMRYNIGANNVALGASAGLGVDGSSTADNSVLLGAGAASAITTGDNNTVIGYQAGDTLTEGSNNIIIGYDIDASAVDVDNELNIGDTIFGDLANNYVGIGTNSPAAALHVMGTSGEVLRLGYDVSNYSLMTIASDGGLTIRSSSGTGDITINPGNTLNLGTSSTDGINIGRTNLEIQTNINGRLLVSTIGGATGLYQDGNANVGIGTGAPTQDGDQALKLDVEGAIGATHYCDEAGDNCSTPAGLAALAAATTGLNEITNAVADNTLTNAANQQIWNWELAAAETGITFGETAASAGGSDDQYIVAAKTLAASTAIPLYIENAGAGDSFRVADIAADTTPFVIDTDGKLQMGRLSNTAQVPHGIISVGETDASLLIQGGVYGEMNSASLDLVGGFANIGTTNHIRIKGRRTSAAVGTNGANLDFVAMARTIEGDTLMSLTHDGKVGIGTTDPDATLEVAGTDSILFPRGTTAQQPSSPVNGMMRYNSENDKFEAYQGGTWQDILTNAAANSVPLSGIGAAIADNSIDNAANEQIWNWELAAAETGITFGESAASADGSDDQYIVAAKTLSASTAIPLYIENAGVGDSFRVADVAADTTPFVIDADGNVTIGNITPAAKVTIDGGILANGGVSTNIRILNTGGVDTMFFASSSGVGGFGTQSNHDLILRTNGTEQARITNSGNVGIGTTDPTQGGDQPLVLEVAGAIGATHYCDEAGLNCSTPAGLAALAAATTALDEITNAVADNTLTNAANEQIWNWELAAAETGITFGETAASAGGSDDQYIVAAKTLSASTAIPLYIENAGAGDSFRVADVAADTTPFVIDADGNVGIGIDDPLQALHIQDGNGRFLFNGSAVGSAYAATFALNDTGLTIGHNSTVRNLALQTNSTDRLVIAQGGNVGIGTDSPSSLLDIETSVSSAVTMLRLKNRTSLVNYGTRIDFANNDSDSNDTIYARIASNNTVTTNGAEDGELIFSTMLNATLTEAMRIDDNGNVGIGTSDPTQGGDQALKLDVEGAIGATHYCDEAGLNCSTPAGLVALAAATTALDEITDAAGANTLTNAAYDQIWNWQLAGAEAGMTFGETAASAGGSDNQYIVAAKTLAGSTAIPLYVENLGDGDSFRVADVAADTTPFVINSTGKVGVGMAAPSAQLDISSPSGTVPFNILQNVAESATPSLGQWSTSSGSIGQVAAETGYFTVHGQASKGIKLFGNGFANRDNGITVTSANNVGIGDDTPSYKLDVAGDIQIQGSVTTCVLGAGSGSTNCTSDERLKTDIVPIVGALDKIAQLRGVTFKWKDESKTQDSQVGVIAQDVEKVFPEIVGELKDDMHTKTVDYAALVAPLIEATKELKAENEALRAELSNTRQDVKALKAHTGYKTSENNLGLGFLIGLLSMGLLSTLVIIFRKNHQK